MADDNQEPSRFNAHDIRRMEAEYRDRRRIAVCLEMLVQLIAEYTGQEVPKGLNLFPELEDKFVPKSTTASQGAQRIHVSPISPSDDADDPLWFTSEAADECGHGPAYIVDRIADGSIKGFKSLKLNRWLVYESSLAQFVLINWNRPLSKSKRRK